MFVRTRPVLDLGIAINTGPCTLYGTLARVEREDSVNTRKAMAEQKVYT